MNFNAFLNTICNVIVKLIIKVWLNHFQSDSFQLDHAASKEVAVQADVFFCSYNNPRKQFYHFSPFKFRRKKRKRKSSFKRKYTRTLKLSEDIIEIHYVKVPFQPKQTHLLLQASAKHSDTSTQTCSELDFITNNLKFSKFPQAKESSLISNFSTQNDESIDFSMKEPSSSQLAIKQLQTRGPETILNEIESTINLNHLVDMVDGSHNSVSKCAQVILQSNQNLSNILFQIKNFCFNELQCVHWIKVLQILSCLMCRVDVQQQNLIKNLLQELFCQVDLQTLDHQIQVQISILAQELNRFFGLDFCDNNILEPKNCVKNFSGEICFNDLIKDENIVESQFCCMGLRCGNQDDFCYNVSQSNQLRVQKSEILTKLHSDNQFQPFFQQNQGAVNSQNQIDLGQQLDLINIENQFSSGYICTDAFIDDTYFASYFKQGGNYLMAV